MEKSSKVLVVGGTGFVGRRIVKASLAQGHRTLVLMRPEIGMDVEKLHLLLSFKAQGAVLVEASMDDHRSLVAAVRQADVVVSAMGGSQLLLQLKLVDAVKEAGNIQLAGSTTHLHHCFSYTEKSALRPVELGLLYPYDSMTQASALTPKHPTIFMIAYCFRTERRILKASLAQGQRTFVLMRLEMGMDIDKLQLLLSFKARGAWLVEVSTDDHQSLVTAVRQADAVMSAMGGS
uniref:Uncharacterized protein n=1 Tax=Avena sativa TaxID=4498 RepID=A0ACD5W4C4_AVESA